MRYGDYFMNHDIRILSLKDRYNGMSQGFWSLLSYEWGPLQIALERFQRVSMGWNKFQLLRVYVLSPHWNPSAFRGICRGYVFHQFITGSWAYLGWTSIFKNGGVRSMWDNFAVRFFCCCAFSGVNRKKSTIHHGWNHSDIHPYDPCVSSVFHPWGHHQDVEQRWVLGSLQANDLLVVGFFCCQANFSENLGNIFLGCVCVCKK